MSEWTSAIIRPDQLIRRSGRRNDSAFVPCNHHSLRKAYFQALSVLPFSQPPSAGAVGGVLQGFHHFCKQFIRCHTRAGLTCYSVKPRPIICTPHVKTVPRTVDHLPRTSHRTSIGTSRRHLPNEYQKLYRKEEPDVPSANSHSSSPLVSPPGSLAHVFYPMVKPRSPVDDPLLLLSIPILVCASTTQARQTPHPPAQSVLRV